MPPPSPELDRSTPLAPLRTAERGHASSVEYFSDLAPSYAANLALHPGFAERFGLFEAWLERLALEHGHLTCIDLGCGPGTLSLAAARRGHDVTAVDGSPKMAAMVTEAARASRLPIRVVQEELPLSDAALEALTGTADVVLASSVIEYLADQGRFVAQCRQLLRPGGTVLISFANSQSVVRVAERRLRATRLYRGSILEVQQHQQTAAAARRLLQAGGFSVIGTRYFSMPAVAYRFWPSRRRPPWLATMFLLAGRR